MGRQAEIYANTDHSEPFDEFLTVLGVLAILSLPHRH